MINWMLMKLEFKKVILNLKRRRKDLTNRIQMIKWDQLQKQVFIVKTVKQLGKANVNSMFNYKVMIIVFLKLGK
jgi:hypothetical protein